MRRRRIALAATAAACALIGGRAEAAAPLVTDPAGDAGPLTVLQPLFGPPLATPPLPSDDSVDLVAADLRAVDGTLEFSTTVVDLTDATPEPYDGRRFYLSVDHAGGRFVADAFVAEGMDETTITYYFGSSGSARIPADLDYDLVTDTVTVSVDIAALNEHIDDASGGRDALVGSGSRFHSASAQTWFTKQIHLLGETYFGPGEYADIAGSDSVYVVP